MSVKDFLLGDIHKLFFEYFLILIDIDDTKQAKVWFWKEMIEFLMRAHHRILLKYAIDMRLLYRN